jgi:hypothetical protein
MQEHNMRSTVLKYVNSFCPAKEWANVFLEKTRETHAQILRCGRPKKKETNFFINGEHYGCRIE